MPILDVQKRYRELGRLRLGRKGPKGNPERLGKWRFTSPDQRLLDAAAVAFGGEVREWAGRPTEGEQWELESETPSFASTSLPRTSPRRCITSGGVAAESRGDATARPNTSPASTVSVRARGNEPAQITTHLAVMLPQLPDVGVWRVRTSSWNAAAEIPSTVDLLQRIHDEGALPLAILGIESRTKRAEGKTTHFALPVLRYPSSIAEAEAAGIPILSHRRETPALEEGRPELPADAAFDRDRAEWGEPLDIPSTEVVEAEVVEGTSAPSPAGDKVDEGTADVAADGEGSTVDEADQADQGTGGDPDGAVSEPDPWSRLQDRDGRIPEDGVAAVKRHAIAHRWGWQPEEYWPADRLEALAEIAREWEEAAGWPTSYSRSSTPTPSGTRSRSSPANVPGVKPRRLTLTRSGPC